MLYEVRWWLDDFGMVVFYRSQQSAFYRAKALTADAWRVEVRRVVLRKGVTALQLLNQSKFAESSEVVSEQEWKA